MKNALGELKGVPFVVQCQQLDFNPNLTEFLENLQKKKQINAHFLPLLSQEY